LLVGVCHWYFKLFKYCINGLNSLTVFIGYIEKVEKVVIGVESEYSTGYFTASLIELKYYVLQTGGQRNGLPVPIGLNLIQLILHHEL